MSKDTDASLRGFFGDGFFDWQRSSAGTRKAWEERHYDEERWWGGFSREPVPQPCVLPQWAIGPFQRYPGNPIFAPSASGWDGGHFGGGVHNGAVVRADGGFAYVYRGEQGLYGRWRDEFAASDFDYICDIGVARSGDGVRFQRDPAGGSLFRRGDDERYSFEDVCLVRHEGVYHLFCNRWDWSRNTDPSVCGVFHAVSPDLIRWEKLGLVFPDAKVIHRNPVVVQNPDNDAVRVGGAFLMYINGGLVAASDDLVHWESREVPELWPGGEGCFALADYSAACPDRILLFTGGPHTGHFYAVGEVSFSRDDPTRPLAWLPRPALHADPSLPWEDGFSAEEPRRPVSQWRDTIFFTGMTRHQGEWRAYYGGSEYYTCLATAPAR
jgi:predicted GH43/DUF377 family glycosyl hydrolase